MEIIDRTLQRYVEEHTSAASSLLHRIEQETRASVPGANMLSGFFQGRLLAMISRLVAPRAILEIGSYTGYSALCMAEGLAEGGKLITIDVNPELEKRTRGYFEQSPYASAIDYRIGDAKAIVPTLDMSFDLVFIDADKKGYKRYYAMALKKVPSGGYLMFDNTLWKGHVADESADDPVTRHIQAFNREIQRDERVENILLPIRDGLTIMRKK